MKLLFALLLTVPILAADGVLTFDTDPDCQNVVYRIETAPVGSTDWTEVACVTTNQWAFTCSSPFQVRVTAQLNPANVNTDLAPVPQSQPSTAIIVFPCICTQLAP